MTEFDIEFKARVRSDLSKKAMDRFEDAMKAYVKDRDIDWVDCRGHASDVAQKVVCNPQRQFWGPTEGPDFRNYNGLYDAYMAEAEVMNEIARRIIIENQREK